MSGASATLGFLFVVAIANIVLGYVTADRLICRGRRRASGASNADLAAQLADAMLSDAIGEDQPSAPDAPPAVNTPMAEGQEAALSEEMPGARSTVERIAKDLSDFEGELAELAARVRRRDAEPTSDMLRAYCSEFDTLVRERLRQLGETTPNLNRLAASAPEMAGQYEQVHAALGALTFRFGSKLASLQRLDFADDKLQDCCEKVTGTVDSALSACQEAIRRLEDPIQAITLADGVTAGAGG
jgi:hypothetical protein